MNLSEPPRKSLGTLSNLPSCLGRTVAIRKGKKEEAVGKLRLNFSNVPNFGKVKAILHVCVSCFLLFPDKGGWRFG